MKRAIVVAGVVVFAGLLLLLAPRDREIVSGPAPAGSPGGATAPAGTVAPRSAESVPEPAGGIVVLDGGRPVSAHVVTLPDPEGPDDGSGLGETGEDGRLRRDEFRRPPDRFVFAVRCPDRRLAPPVPWREEGVVLSLGEGGVVTGRVLDPDGEPVAGASVLAWPGKAHALSDRKGRYRLAGLTPLRPTKFLATLPGRGHSEPFERKLASWTEVVEHDFVVDARAEGVLLDLTWAGTPESMPRLRVTGTKPELTLELPPRNVLVRLPPAEPGAAIAVGVSCPGYRIVEETVVAPPAGEEKRVRLRLWRGGLPVRGRVVDAEGRPVPGVDVTCREEPSIEADWRGGETTGPDGRFRIRADWVGRHLLAARPAESTSDWFELTPDRTEVELVLRAGATATGRVLDRDTGAPISGATVELIVGSDASSDEWRTETDEAGEWHFRGIPAGTFVRAMVVTTFRAQSLEDPRSRHHVVRSDAIRDGTAKILGAGEVFRRDLTAVGVPGARLLLSFTVPEEAKSEPFVTVEHVLPDAGWFANRRIENRPGNIEIPFYCPEGKNVVRVKAGRFSASTGEFVVTAGGDLGERTIRFEGAASVVVRLVGEDGAPVRRAGVRVRLAFRMRTGWGSTGGSIGSVDTDAEGRAILDAALPAPDVLASEGYEILVTLAGPGIFRSSPFGENADLVVPGSELLARRAAADEELVLEVPVRESVPATLFVVDQAGNPVPGVRLRLSEGDFTAEEAVSGPDGRVTLGLRFDRESWHHGAAVTALPPFIGALTDAERSGPLVLMVRRARALTIRLVDEEGRALGGTVVGIHGSFVPRGFGKMHATTDPDGRLTIDVPGGKATLDLTLPSDEWLSESREVAPGETELLMRFYRLHPLRLRVIAPAELAPERALAVRCRVEVDGRESILRGEVARTTGREFAGEIRVPNLPRRLEVVSPDDVWGATAESRPGDEEVVLTLERRALHRVVLVLVDRRGKPLAGLGITPDRSVTHLAILRFLPDELRSDAEGRVVVEVPEGEWRLPRLRSESGHWLAFGTIRAPASEPFRFELNGP